MRIDTPSAHLIGRRMPQLRQLVGPSEIRALAQLLEEVAQAAAKAAIEQARAERYAGG